jgi:hypothetical protein
MLLVLEGGTKLLLLMLQDNACWRQGGVLGSEVVKGKAEVAVCRRKLNVWSEFFFRRFLEWSIMAVF